MDSGGESGVILLQKYGILGSAGAGADTYWIGTYGGTGSEPAGSSITIAVDSNSNGYIGFRTDSAGAGAYDAAFIKISKDATLELQRTIGLSNYENGMGIAVGSTGNIYLSGNYGNPIYAEGLVAKFNSTGTVQWQRGIDGGSSNSLSFYGIGLDSSENAYAFGFDGTGDSCFLAKYNSAGTYQWQRYLYGSNTDICYGGTVTPSGDIFITGYTRSGSVTRNAILVAKYDSAGTFQWDTHLYGASSGDAQGDTIAIDSAGNIYVVGTSFVNNASGELVVIKLNSSGTLVWQRRIGTTGRATSGAGIAIDDDDNIYAVGYHNPTTWDQLFVVKYNSAGTLQWQNTLGTTTAGTNGYSVALDSKGNIWAAGRTLAAGAGSQDVFVAKLPNDGSLLGNYTLDGVTFTYQAGTTTDNAGTLTQNAISLTAGTPSYSTLTPSLTVQTPSLTWDYTEL